MPIRFIYRYNNIIYIIYNIIYSDRWVNDLKITNAAVMSFRFTFLPRVALCDNWESI